MKNRRFCGALQTISHSVKFTINITIRSRSSWIWPKTSRLRDGKQTILKFAYKTINIQKRFPKFDTLLNTTCKISFTNSWKKKLWTILFSWYISKMTAITTVADNNFQFVRSTLLHGFILCKLKYKYMISEFNFYN